MLLRSRTLSPASLAARRANALKSTGPRTAQGRARVALNPLRHGRSAVSLPEKLARAGYRQDEAEWRAIRARIAQTFQRISSASAITGPERSEAAHGPEEIGPPEPRRGSKVDRHLGTTVSGPTFEKKMDRLANCVWCAHRSWQEHSGAKLKSALNSVESQARLTEQLRICAPPQIRIQNPWARQGLVFYTQRRRGWGWQFITELMGRRAATGPQSDSRPEMGPEMETGLRSRVYPLGRPRFWERIRYCLDAEGNYHAEWQGEFRQARQELRNSPMAMWLEPHPILAELRQNPERQTEDPGTRSQAGRRDVDSPDFAGEAAARAAPTA